MLCSNFSRVYMFCNDNCSKLVPGSTSSRIFTRFNNCQQPARKTKIRFNNIMKGIIIFTSKLEYGDFLSLNMLVYNIYTYVSLSFKVIISSIYEVLVHTSSYSMLKSMIFLTFNTNIITILYFQYIYSLKNLNILQLLSWICLEVYMMQNN